ncbi:MAG: hypothetical protein ACYSSP_11540 [Planctomycetota bacterium]|jgi:hypothetical protein
MAGRLMLEEKILEEQIASNEDPIIRQQFQEFLQQWEKRRRNKKVKDPNYLNKFPAIAIIALTIFLCLSFAAIFFMVLSWLGKFVQII